MKYKVKVKSYELLKISLRNVGVQEFWDKNLRGIINRPAFTEILAGKCMPTQNFKEAVQVFVDVEAWDSGTPMVLEIYDLLKLLILRESETTLAKKLNYAGGISRIFSLHKKNLTKTKHLERRLRLSGLLEKYEIVEAENV